MVAARKIRAAAASLLLLAELLPPAVVAKPMELRRNNVTAHLFAQMTRDLGFNQIGGTPIGVTGVASPFEHHFVPGLPAFVIKVPRWLWAPTSAGPAPTPRRQEGRPPRSRGMKPPAPSAASDHGDPATARSSMIHPAPAPAPAPAPSALPPISPHTSPVDAPSSSATAAAPGPTLTPSSSPSPAAAPAPAPAPSPAPAPAPAPSPAPAPAPAPSHGSRRLKLLLKGLDKLCSDWWDKKRSDEKAEKRHAKILKEIRKLRRTMRKQKLLSRKQATATTINQYCVPPH